MNNKRGQHTTSIPFGIIFSIILIVFFIVIAFIAIRFFLDLGQVTEVELFYDRLQEKIDKVCFGNLTNTITNRADHEVIKKDPKYSSEHNIFLIPPEATGETPSKILNHINISIITQDRNPYCVRSTEDLRIKKDFYDVNVIIQ